MTSRPIRMLLQTSPSIRASTKSPTFQRRSSLGRRIASSYTSAIRRGGTGTPSRLATSTTSKTGGWKKRSPPVLQIGGRSRSRSRSRSGGLFDRPTSPRNQRIVICGGVKEPRGPGKVKEVGSLAGQYSHALDRQLDEIITNYRVFFSLFLFVMLIKVYIPGLSYYLFSAS